MADRFVVTGPAGFPRAYHTKFPDALKAVQKCSAKHPNAICTISRGLPGLQRPVMECARSECYTVEGGMGRRRKRSRKRR